MRSLCLLLVLAGSAHAAANTPDFLEAVEFPYPLIPRQLWERELVWLKNIGVQTVACSIETGDSGSRTNPRLDFLAFLRILRRLDMKLWIRPGAIDASLARDLATQVESHGGPIAFAEDGAGAFDLPPPPSPLTLIALTDASALSKSRTARAAGRGSILWRNVEDTISPLLRKGAVSFTGEERASTQALRRNALLGRYWGAALNSATVAARRPVAGKLPGSVKVRQLIAPGASAVSVINEGENSWRGELRVFYPPLKRELALPPVQVPRGEALWLPVGIPLASGPLCRDCAAFGPNDWIVYATAELNVVEFENGLLAMEFAAPVAGEVVLRLSQKPTGPLLAAGHPMEFDWDEANMRARLPIPAGSGPAHRVRIGLAIEPPDQSAFFVDASRLIIGRPNEMKTSYSSEEIAQRSRLRLPDRFHATPEIKSPTEIVYRVEAPPDALHGEFVDFGLEADGVLMSHARLQLLRPVSMRIREAVNAHFGPDAELPIEPPIIPIDPQAGREVVVTIHNNYPEIRTFVLEAEGAGFEFSPKKIEISIGAAAERDVSLHVFAEKAERGLQPWMLRLTGAASLEMPSRFAVIPRTETAAYSTDLYGDGNSEWILENQKVRAVFAPRDAGRWLEFVWKPLGINVLPEAGALPESGTAQVAAIEDGLEFRGNGWLRTVRLAGDESRIVIEQTTALPPDLPRSERRAGAQLTVTRESAWRAVFLLESAASPRQ